MARIDDWADVEFLSGQRLDLEPLRPVHAEEMAPLLDDPDLHVYVGGEPATLLELRGRYSRQAAGRSPDGSQRWLNWILRRRDDGQAVGTVQATVAERGGVLAAEIAWVVGAPYHHRGYAQEAARVMVAYLRRQDVTILIAHIHPQHAASVAVARAVGLEATETLVDGEVRWQG